jgi:glutamate/tyrosine decarboxylase-like PLP-dependent enzyme
MSLQCARRVDALKLWLSWKFYGDKGYDDIITNLFELAEYATQFIQKHNRLELVAPRNSVSVCFRYVINEGIDGNHFNIMIRDHLYKAGKSFINYTAIDNRVAMRLILTNPNLTKKDIDRFFNNLLATAEELGKTGKT